MTASLLLLPLVQFVVVDASETEIQLSSLLRFRIVSIAVDGNEGDTSSLTAESASLTEESLIAMVADNEPDDDDTEVELPTTAAPAHLPSEKCT